MPRIVRDRITREEVAEIAAGTFVDMVKAVVDVERRVLALGAELHSDDEAALLDDGSRQADLWGINPHLDEPSETWIEFDSLINVRPSQGNRSRGVDDEALREEIRAIVAERIDG